MKRRIWTLVVTAAIQLFLAFTPYIPLTAPFWHVDSPEEFNAVLGSFIGVQLLLMTTALILVLQSEGHDLTGEVERLVRSFPLTTIKRLRDRQFYSDFRHAVENSQHSVRICYFAPYPPTEVQYSDRKRYYEDIQNLMKHKDRVNFQRIVRRTSANDEWVAKLIRDLKGKANINIAVLEKDLPAEFEMPLALSVQIVDEKQVWLVATASHESEREFRDLFIENPDAATALTDYFERIWAHSTPVLDHGRLTERGTELVEAANGN